MRNGQIQVIYNGSMSWWYRGSALFFLAIASWYGLVNSTERFKLSSLSPKNNHHNYQFAIVASWSKIIIAVVSCCWCCFVVVVDWSSCAWRHASRDAVGVVSDALLLGSIVNLWLRYVTLISKWTDWNSVSVLMSYRCLILTCDNIAERVTLIVKVSWLQDGLETNALLPVKFHHETFPTRFFFAVDMS